MAIFGLFFKIIMIVKFYRDEKGKNKKIWWHQIFQASLLPNWNFSTIFLA